MGQSVLFWRIWKIQLAVIVLAAIALLTTFGVVIAQTQQAERADQEERRLERKVETIQRDHAALKLDIEKRLAIIETYLNAGIWILGGIGTLMLAQLGSGLLTLMVKRHDAKAGD